jgi:predicted nucleic acid-binding protein
MDIVDTNILVAIFRKQENQHIKAKEIFSFLKEIQVLDLVLVELSNVLETRESKVIAKNALQNLMEAPQVKIIRLTDTEFQKSYMHFYSNTHSLVDSALITLKKTRNANIHTFNKKLQKALI